MEEVCLKATIKPGQVWLDPHARLRLVLSLDSQATNACAYRLLDLTLGQVSTSWLLDWNSRTSWKRVC